MASRDIDKYNEFEISLTIKSNLQVPSMAELINRYDVARSEIAMHLDWEIEILTQTLNVGNTMNTFQKKDLVYNFLDKYKNESLEDVALCFKMAKDGQFGVIYNRIDREVINLWMSKYLELKSYEREAEVTSARKIHDNNLLMTPDQIREWYKTGTENQARLEALRNKIKQDEFRGVQEKEDKERGYSEFRKEFLARRESANLPGEGMGTDDSGSEIKNISIPEERASADTNSISS